MRRAILTAALSVGLAIATSTTAEPVKAEPTKAGVISEGPATQMATTQYVFHSAKTGRNYLIKVTAPFTPVPRGETRPVVYALDGGYEVAGPIAWVMGGGGGMKQAFVVSVGYLPADYGWRATDLAFRAYTDDYDKAKVNSGALAFRAFLNEELRPFITAHLPVDDTRAVLFGHSEGALFAANVLADRPQEYAGYILGSPAVWSDPTILDRLRAGLPRAHGQRVFLAIGGAETPQMLDGARRIDELLKANSAITETSETYAAATHISYYPALVSEALPWVLGR